MTRELVIWSRFGLWRTTTDEELRAGGVIERTWDEVEVELAEFGFCLTFIDVERVAILPGYPDDKEPQAVLDWLNNETGCGKLCSAAKRR